MPDSLPSFARLINLASERLGARAVATSDDFFAPMSLLVKDAAPVFKVDEYTDRGKWMDGWESRRKRGPGHDWCIVKLAMAGRLRGADVDTSHFRGNHPPFISIDAALIGDTGSIENASWTTLINRAAAEENAHNYFEIINDTVFDCVRLNIFPDGGVARLRVFGEVEAIVPADREVELSCITNGGKTIACSDEHFGRMLHLILPDRPINMGDGWETKRRRGPGHDWVVVELGYPGTLSRVEVDTTHFKGNYPDSCEIEGGNSEDPNDRWDIIVPNTKLLADNVHVFDSLQNSGPYRYVRLRIYPDGGVARLRVFGRRS